MCSKNVIRFLHSPIRNKAKPVVKQGRKASGFRSELAGLPYQSGSSVFFFVQRYVTLAVR